MGHPSFLANQQQKTRLTSLLAPRSVLRRVFPQRVNRLDSHSRNFPKALKNRLHSTLVMKRSSKAQAEERALELVLEAGIAEEELSPSTRSSAEKMRFLRTLVCGTRYERAARKSGASIVAGVDEVGRGALFGPVVAAAVILPEKCRIPGLRDSKQLLPEQRERFACTIERKALAIAIEEVDSETIDRVNIYQASKMAMTAAVSRLQVTPDHLLIDAMRLDLECAQTSIIYGDSLSISIAAASVMAKVYRDRRMCELDQQFPQYGLASHKGYSTPKHKKALLAHGPSPLHRRSFFPVAQVCLPWD
jgi:ribonuclease HII